jgi:hypothetical protein
MIFVENQVLKVERDLVLVIFMRESRKWLVYKCFDLLWAMTGKVMLG